MAGFMAIRAGSYRATIEAPPEILASLQVAFRDLVPPAPPAGDPGAQIVVHVRGDAFVITVDGVQWSQPDVQSPVDQLVYALMRATLDAEPGLLHVHAGLVSWRGRGALIAGVPGSGKSTLITRLVDAGFDYLTDERVGIDPDLRLRPVPKPISLTTAAPEALAGLDVTRSGRGVASDRLWHVAASDVRPGSVVSTTTLGAIVFVQYQPGAPLLTTEVHPATAARRLLADSPDAVRFGPDAVVVAARLCAAHRCAHMLFGTGDDAVDALRSITGSTTAPSAAAPVEALGTRAPAGGRTFVPPAIAPDSVLELARGVSGASVDGRCVLMRHATGEVIELDPVDSAWLQLLDGRATLTEIVAEVAAANAMEEPPVMATAAASLRTLAEIGVVE